MNLSSFQNSYSGLNVFVTGHTGFKGSWLSFWLQALGAKVTGYSLSPPTQPNHFSLIHLESKIHSIEGDIRDLEKLQKTMMLCKPDIIFHLAAQPIVLTSFENPKETFDINSGGSVNLLEAAKNVSSVKAIVMITSDKCYDNQEWTWGYRETDKLGGHDPYSASKAMAELAIASYRHSFFQNSAAIASARAGNVIGGGDFSAYRLVPDTMKALMQNKTISVRNPQSVRPWLHVLEPLSGYLWLGAKLLQEGLLFSDAWNFGPKESQGVTVKAMVEKAIDLWGSGSWIEHNHSEEKKEMVLLRLNCDKAANRLNWSASFHWEQAVEQTVQWFQAFQAQKKSMDQVCLEQIEFYTACAAENEQPWAKVVRFTELPLTGAYLIDLEPHCDNRGFFARFFCKEEMKIHGLESQFIQMNTSQSKSKGTLRGLHYQLTPYQETKVVRCLRGSLFDVILDLRPDSPSFGKWHGSTLTAENRTMMYAPKGFAHGFLTLEPDTEILYLVSVSYSKERERGIRWDDPRFEVQWPIDPLVISERDLLHPNFDPLYHLDQPFNGERTS